MLGFVPGFAYLGGLDSRIATPRRATPRAHVPAGSVAIAGEQTAVYPLDTPGGWQLIGRTPLQLFKPDSSPPSLLNAGDQVRFMPISAVEFEAQSRAAP
jgi:inhibitor of KinA